MDLKQARFRTTQWTLIVAAGAPMGDDTRGALEELSRRYWYPLYSFVRRRGYGVPEAEDLTQSFFAKLLSDRNTLLRADPERGKFRSYLLGTLKHFLATEAASARASKRGGGRRVVPLEVGAAETRVRAEPAHAQSPEWHFDRQ